TGPPTTATRSSSTCATPGPGATAPPASTSPPRLSRTSCPWRRSAPDPPDLLFTCRKEAMSLDVPTAVLEAAERREMDDAQFLAVVRDSLPYAWEVVSAAAADRTGDKPF